MNSFGIGGSIANTTTIAPPGAPSRRNTELVLLVFAVVIPVFAYANVGLAKTGSLPAGMAAYGLGLGALAAVAHLMVRWRAPYADPLLLPLATLLNGIGLVLIWRLDQEPSLTDRFGEAAPNQLMWSGLGVAFFLAVLFFLKDHRVLQRYTYISMVVGLVLLVLPVFFSGGGSYGAKVWVHLGPINFQPGEFAKIILAVFFAGYLMVKRDALALASRRFMGLYLPRGRDLGPILVIWVLSLLILVFENDLGTSLLFFGVFVVMLYVATERTSWIVIGLLMSIGGAVVVGATAGHVQRRVDDWLDPMRVVNGPEGLVDQAAQSMFSFGSGGLLGTGLGQGHSYLIGFAANSDFILTTVGEELGLTGMMALFMLFALLIERGLRTAIAARDPFGKLFTVGISSVLALQVFVVAGGVTGLIPLTGMVLPFLAQGGSSVITNWALVAILIRISDSARRPAPVPAPMENQQTQVVRRPGAGGPVERPAEGPGGPGSPGGYDQERPQTPPEPLGPGAASPFGQGAPSGGPGPRDGGTLGGDPAAGGDGPGGTPQQQQHGSYPQVPQQGQQPQQRHPQGTPPE